MKLDLGFFSPGKKKTLILIVLAALLLFMIVVMWINSIKPDPLDLRELDTRVKGTAFVQANQILIDHMHHNWLPNDLFWPTALLDNMPNFQIGELEVIRYNTRVLRDNLSRMRTTDKLDPDAESAFTALSNDPYKWWFPSSESKWKLARKHLGIYHDNLLNGRSHFYPRADNLVELLSQYASLMGGANTRLINAPRDLDQSLALEGGPGEDSKPPKMVDINIPWYRVDNNFYYAQGISHALHGSFEAIKVDFKGVLVDKNSVTLVDKILEDLNRCHFEPIIILNGGPASLFANHSLNLSGMFNDARQKINSLIVALKQG